MAYQIDFSDPSKSGFSVSDYSFDGPGGITTNSSLRLYGRNAQEWGESVNENLLRLNENWASATPPLNPINGQSWVKEEIYWRNSSVFLFPAGSAPATSFYRYDFATNTWIDISANVEVINGGSPTLVIGRYVYDIADASLKLYDSQYKQTTPSLLNRSYRTETTTPLNGTDFPNNSFLVYNQAEDTWSSLTPNIGTPVSDSFVKITTNDTGNITNTTPVTTADITALVDSVYVNVSGDTMTGDLTMSGGSKVTGLPIPSNNSDAATKQYVDNQDALKLSLTGGVMSGPLTLSGPPSGGNEAATKTYVDNLVDAILPVGMVIDYAGTSAPTGWLLCNGQDVSRTTYANLFAVIGTTYGAGDGSTTFNVPDARGRTSVGVGSAITTEFISGSASSNALPVASNTSKWFTGMPVTVSGVTGYSGLTNGLWWIVRVNNTQVRFANSLANAQNNQTISITGTGSATITYTGDNRTLSEIGGEDKHAMTIDELLNHRHTIGAAFLQDSGTGFPERLANVGSINSSFTGGNTAMNNMQPFIVFNKIIKY